MSIFIVSGVMHRPDGASKLVHGISTQPNSEAAIGVKTKEWLDLHKGYALEQIICSELPENIYKSEEVEHLSTGSDLTNAEGVVNETENETKT